MQNLEGKKLLVLGGAFQHCKLVEAAKELGVIVYVCDYLEPDRSPAKLLADKHYNYNITDFDKLCELCDVEDIDGVISTSLDACQRPYQTLCERLNKPCFGTAEQYKILTDKNTFKRYCRKNGVDVIPEYHIDNFSSAEKCANTVQFPILIKPCDSRGSRGQSICQNYEEAVKGIEFAKSESSNGEIVIEKYMGQKNDFSMTIVVINGKAYPYRTVDRILGKYEDRLDKLAVGATMPSTFTDLYMKNVHSKIETLIKDIGLYTAPMFMQGFVDGDTVRFYDPGLRLPGGEYERMFKAATGKNIFYSLIEFALTGKVSDDSAALSKDDIWLNGKVAYQVLPTLRGGIIGKIEGLEEIRANENVISVFDRYVVGDEITETHNVSQRFCEIDIVCDSKEIAKATVEWIYSTLKITDTNGDDMIVSRFSLD